MPITGKNPEIKVYNLKSNCARTLRPIISNNAHPSRITATAGTRISQDFLQLKA